MQHNRDSADNQVTNLFVLQSFQKIFIKSHANTSKPFIHDDRIPSQPGFWWTLIVKPNRVSRIEFIRHELFNGYWELPVMLGIVIRRFFQRQSKERDKPASDQ